MTMTSEHEYGKIILIFISRKLKTIIYKELFSNPLLLLFLTYSVFVLSASNSTVFSQQLQPSQTYVSKPSVFRQEIARLEITVQREGKLPLSLTQVPRLQAGDILKVKMLDEPVGGIKPDQSQWDWTLLIAYINPNRNQDKEKSVSQELRFREKGWYTEHFFTVPYDSQPVIFLYPRPKYRDKILKLVTEDYDNVRKLGEKTIEIAGAYAQIKTFLNELQGVLRDPYYNTLYNQNQSSSTNPYNSYNNGTGSSYYNTYGSGSSYYSSYGGYGSSVNPSNHLWMDQMVEGLARSFNIQLPDCWRGGYNSSSYSPYSTSNPYSTYSTGSSTYNSSNYYSYGNPQDFVSRTQCVAKNVRLEDFDVSITRMWQGGGVFLAAQLTKKYPQLAYYINIAAAAIDFIVKVFQKTALRIVPTVVSTNEALSYGNSYYSTPSYNSSYSTSYTPGNSSATGTQSSYYSSSAQSGNSQPQSTAQQSVQPGSSTYNPAANTTANQNPSQSGAQYSNQNGQTYSPSTAYSSATSTTSKTVKISLYADSQPSDNNFVTAFPVVLHKWQAEPDPNIIVLPAPVLLDPCLHAGQNILKNTDLSEEWVNDTFTRDFKLVMNASNGFQKEFPLKKNVGLGGWELLITPQDLSQIPKVNMAIQAEIVGFRGFNEVRSEKLDFPIASGGAWTITPESQKNFIAGGKHLVILQNSLGSCRCLQSVIYRPSSGGQFVFEANGGPNGLTISSGGREASFEINTNDFKPGTGTLELRTYGGDAVSLNLRLYPLPPNITDVKMAKGDTQTSLIGERLEQIQSIKINGKRARAAGISPSINNGAVQNQNQPLGQKTFVFEDPSARQLSDSISLELGLEDDRSFAYPQKFSVGLSRPTIAADESNEIEGFFISAADNKNSAMDQSSSLKSQLDLGHYPVVPIDVQKMSLTVQNKLTDYDFKIENLSIETRIEKSQAGAVELPNADFEVLDSNKLRLNLTFNELSQKLLGGRRLQFRIRDKERGYSDWYTIRQTFIRLPRIDSVKCTPEMKGQCEMKGTGMDYIDQVSVDGGKTWYSGDKGKFTGSSND